MQSLSSSWHTPGSWSSGGESSVLLLTSSDKGQTHAILCVCVCVCVRACVCVCEGGHVVESSGWFPWPQGEPVQYQHTSRRLIKPLYQFTVIIMTACPSEQEYSRAQPCHAMPQNEISIPLTVDTVAIELHLESHHVSVRACVFERVHLVFVHRPLV